MGASDLREMAHDGSVAISESVRRGEGFIGGGVRIRDCRSACGPSPQASPVRWMARAAKPAVITAACPPDARSLHIPLLHVQLQYFRLIMRYTAIAIEIIEAPPSLYAKSWRK